MKPARFSLKRCLGTTLFIGAISIRPASAQHVISIFTDGRDEIQIVNGNLVVQHFSWSLPSDLVVDGTPEPLTWNGNTSIAIPVGITGDYWVRKTVGRDGGYAAQRSDGFTLAAVS